MVKKHSLIKDLFAAFISEINQGLAVINVESGLLEVCNHRFAEIIRIDHSLLRGEKIGEIIPGFDVYKNETDKVLRVAGQHQVRFKFVDIGNEQLGSFILVFVSEVLPQEQEDMTFMNEAFRTVLDHIDEGVLIADDQNRITYCNQVQLNFDGLKLKDILGKYSWDVYDFNAEISMMRKCVETEKPIDTYVQYYISNSGQYVRVTGNNLPVRHNEKTVGSVAIYRNLRKSEDMACKIIELQKKISEDQPDLEGALISGGASKKKYFSFDDILGVSHGISRSIEVARLAAQSDSPVFIYGETGTGKEMFAQSIHSESDRSNKPLVSINCAAIPENLLEGIIFGTLKGVFTGAADRKGLFEEADGGTIFLDEINSMPIALQSKLLRVLEERKVRRLGGKEEIPVDVRIISCSNVPPQQAITENQIRNDLYYRLAVINIEIPPLRERREDIQVLTQFFVGKFNLKFKKHVCQISPEIFELVKSYDWPGNVRQLKHWVESAMNMIPADEPIFSEQYAPQGLHVFYGKVRNTEKSDKKGEVFTQIHENERLKIEEALKRNSGNISKTAQELGISRQVLYYRMRKFEIR
ncbi:sigma-54 interaction domain-containing protein [Dehalobacterium formicoaceticum]|uniref:sigma-54 interaction domain-containing protein n=1 Tax=Dehalobacterium formicoaceticum TaxID=51515 RepID=UPI000B7C90CE|nr:sigma 54-interacting transcriptional regulator [Dehalobacterium formicoaceticum]